MKAPAHDRTVYSLRITMREIEPPIWRLLQVQASMKLVTLHEVLQVAFSWTDTHLFEFENRDRRIGIPDEEWDDGYDPDTEDAARVRLRDVLRSPGEEMLYRYDFGDGWEHDIVLEKVEPADPAARYPTVLDGARRPKEDCGGPPGYEEFVEAWKNPRHREHRAVRRWAGPYYDPESLDLGLINRALHVFAPRWKRPVAPHEAGE